MFCAWLGVFVRVKSLVVDLACRYTCVVFRVVFRVLCFVFCVWRVLCSAFCFWWDVHEVCHVCIWNGIELIGWSFRYTCVVFCVWWVMKFVMGWN